MAFFMREYGILLALPVAACGLIAKQFLLAQLAARPWNAMLCQLTASLTSTR